MYERLGTEHKLDGDITAPQTWEDDPNQTKFVLGKLNMTNHMAIGIRANSTAVGSFIFMTYNPHYKNGKHL